MYLTATVERNVGYVNVAHRDKRRAKVVRCKHGHAGLAYHAGIAGHVGATCDQTVNADVTADDHEAGGANVDGALSANLDSAIAQRQAADLHLVSGQKEGTQDGPPDTIHGRVGHSHVVKRNRARQQRREHRSGELISGGYLIGATVATE